jgi:hypothetical protein
MGALSADEMHISPVVSIVLLIVMVLLMDFGSRYFIRKMRVPALQWSVLDHIGGELMDAEVRQTQLAASGPNRRLQADAASSLAVLQTLTSVRSDGIELEEAEALVDLVARYTASSRGHAAVGLAVAAVSPATCDQLLEVGALEKLLALAGEAEAQDEAETAGSAALGIALLAQVEAGRTRLLEAQALPTILSLLSSVNYDAVRCAAHALASLAELPAARNPITAAFPAKVLVMLCRSHDTFLQVGSGVGIQ